MTRRWMRLTLAVCAAAVTLAASPARQAPPASSVRQTPAAAASDTPRLLVLISIDQFTGDYIPRYGHQWTKGLRRLVDAGAYFPLGAYPYGVTKTCPGHFTIGTGTLPRTHGQIDNAWYDRARGRSIPCTDDPNVTSVAFGGAAGGERHSPRLLLTPSLADELRLQQAIPARVLSMSLKPRSAIGLAGHPGPGTMVLWQEDNGAFATSSAFAAAPWPGVDAYVSAHPIASAVGETWTKLLPDSTYLSDDDAPGEASQGVFPHPLAGPSGNPDSAFVGRWRRSPWSDAYLGDMAASLTQTLKLGQGRGTDLLAISFSALDLVGHDYGPRSHEVQDVLARLDVVLGELLATLDAAVGVDRYTLALTADHGVTPLPEQAKARGIDAGRFRSGDVRTAIETALDEALGGETWVANVTSPYVYFTPALVSRVLESPRAKDAVARAMVGIPGIQRAYWASEIAAAGPNDDESLRRLRDSYVAGRSGDVAFVVTPYWVPQSTGAAHGSPHAYDRWVPVVLFGAGITPGRYLTEASPVDIAPTLAWLAGVRPARTDGRILMEALTQTSVASRTTGR